LGRGVSQTADVLMLLPHGGDGCPLPERAFCATTRGTLKGRSSRWAA
jgi:hypothetical protein